MIQYCSQWLRSSLRSLAEFREGQISALDGLRAIAITLVIASHSKNDFVYVGGKQEPAGIFWFLNYTWTGVDLFFVLSGFLIGKILFQEMKQTGTVQVAPFLLKRGLRIWPLYYFICAVGLLRLMLAHAVPTFTALLPDFLFLTNYFKENLAYGSWSLAIEEQYYLIASLLILVFRHQIARHRTKIPVVLSILLLLAPMIRMVVWNHYLQRQVDPFVIEWDALHNYIFTHYDGLVIGLIFAGVVVLRTPESSLSPKKLEGWLLGFLAITAGCTYFYRVYFIYSFAAFLYGTAVWHCLTSPLGRVAKALSWPSFQVLSRLSYGMYLWYRFPLWRIAHFVMANSIGFPALFQFLLIFIIDFICALLLASFTYVLIERPFLELRSKLYRPASA